MVLRPRAYCSSPQSSQSQVSDGSEPESINKLTTVEIEERKAKLLTHLDLHIDHMDSGQQKTLTDLLMSYSDVFALDSSELGTTDVVSYQINTVTTHLCYSQSEEPSLLVEKMVNEMLE